MNYKFWANVFAFLLGLAASLLVREWMKPEVKCPLAIPALSEQIDANGSEYNQFMVNIADREGL